jgi:hypothetical protein
MMPCNRATVEPLITAAPAKQLSAAQRDRITAAADIVQMGYKKGVFGAKVEGKLRDAFLDATGTIAGDPLAGDQIPVVIAAMKEVKQDEVDAQGSLSLGVRARLAANLFKGMENFPTGIEKLPEMINALMDAAF